MSASDSNISVSVVIPMRNSSATILRAIRSVEQQAAPPMEVLIVDNNSTDSSRRIVENYSSSLNIRVLECSTPGSGAARNIGVQSASGTHLAFLDADDVWYPDKLRLQVRALQKGYSLVGSFFHYLDSRGKVLGDSRKLIGKRDPASELRRARAMPAPISSLVIDKALIEKHGALDETFMRAQDFEWLVRLGQHSDLFISGSHPLIGYVMSKGSATATDYAEQALAADLVKRRAQGYVQGTYQSDVVERLKARRLPRRVIAGHHYRQAGVAWGEKEHLKFIVGLTKAVALSPFVTIRKLFRQSVGSRGGSEENPVSHLFADAEHGK